MRSAAFLALGLGFVIMGGGLYALTRLKTDMIDAMLANDPMLRTDAADPTWTAQGLSFDGGDRAAFRHGDHLANGGHYRQLDSSGTKGCR